MKFGCVQAPGRIMLILFLLISLAGCIEVNTEAPSKPLEYIRSANTDEQTVIDYSGKYYVKDGELYHDNDKIAEVRSDTYISKIGDCLYYLCDGGLQQINVTTHKKKDIFIDTMSQAVVGTNYIYYVTDGFLWAFNGKQDFKKVCSADNIIYVYNTLIVFEEEGLTIINLLNDNIYEYQDYDIIELEHGYKIITKNEEIIIVP